MRNGTPDCIESADFVIEIDLCIVISRAQGRPETGSAETQKFFLKIYKTIQVRTIWCSLVSGAHERMLKCK